MDGRTNLNELYIVDRNNRLDEDNVEKYDEAMNNIKGWVKMEQLQN